jgi:hypothetical protein
VLKFISIFFALISLTAEAQYSHFGKVGAIKIYHATTPVFFLSSINSTLKLRISTHEVSLNDSIRHSKKKTASDSNYALEKRAPLWQPMLSVVESTVVLWFIDRYILNETTSKIGIQSWRTNLKYGWEWGKVNFGQSFFSNMINGATYYNCARPLGYNFYQSIPFTLGGTVMLEFFGHTLRPTYNDLIYTPVNGIFFGEILYRLSSDILDERTRGFERVVRELLAAAINPGRAVTRLFQGRIFKVVNFDRYVKEPLDFEAVAGVDVINHRTKFRSGTANAMFKLSFDYGDPFEVKNRYIMDFFKLSIQFATNSGRRWLSNVSEYGLLYGKNYKIGEKEILGGFFQHYDFIDNPIYDISTMSFGGGALSRMPISKKSKLLLNAYLGIVPFGGDSRYFNIADSSFRDYNYGGGLESKLECGVAIAKWLKFQIKSDYYWIHTYVGAKGDYITGIVTSGLYFKFLKRVVLGAEYVIFNNNKFESNQAGLHYTNTEERVYLAYHINCCHN